MSYISEHLINTWLVYLSVLTVAYILFFLFITYNNKIISYGWWELLRCFYINIPCFIEDEILNNNNLLECSFGFLFISVSILLWSFNEVLCHISDIEITMICQWFVRIL